MAKFDEPFHANLDTQKVMIGGKSLEQRKSDLEAGVARIGGFWRHPNYFQAYLHSASLLIEQGRATETLDEVGLPAFYLQRHAIELLLKSLLSWLTNISDLRNDLGRSKEQPSDDLKDALRKSHDLKKLHGHLLEFGAALNVPPPPAELGSLIESMGQVEITETWSRYSSSSKKSKDGARIQVKHIPEEILIPIVELQEGLDAIAVLVSARVAFGETYEDELHDIWAQLNADLDRA
ncbi:MULTISPECIES: hypothetical protein [Pseudomonas]|uniref:Uncharacterized protein n=1 Tax=Pseudomonas fluorescens LMG 5329 TaxID=1324332 RepID=A0A0A1Z9Q1_PSEFL|nr:MULTISPECIES: hypothetical protein [Pseudomonas]KGE69706.1 hypothetical protein K814_0101125 [Pseudomonas fluorescens LMG 5329]NWE03510.1 hypothetical protein [Pseudomonas sp. IPO3749]NWF24116.1 hypothetical protein [Pseudomonas sp. IPO3749]